MAPSGLLVWGDWLYEEAQQVFQRDGTHGQVLFLFGDQGIGRPTPSRPTRVLRN